MTISQELVLTFKKNKGHLKLSFHFFHLGSMSVFLTEIQSGNGVYYSLDI